MSKFSTRSLRLSDIVVSRKVYFVVSMCIVRVACVVCIQLVVCSWLLPGVSGHIMWVLGVV